MFDFLGLRIHFKDAFVTPVAVADDYEMHINFDDLVSRGLRLECSVDVDEVGETQISSLRHAWDSIPSSYTGIAFKVFQGSGFKKCACVELKASPAKVMQGHNVYGSDSLLECSTFILDALKKSMPDFCEMLDFTLTDVFRMDCTYSLQLESKDQLQGALTSLTRVSNKYLRPSRQGEFESTVYFNKDKNNPNTGRTTSLCVYSKLDEVQHQLKHLESLKRKDKTSIYDKVIDELSSPELNDFATNRLRFESRCMSRWFQKNNIPQNLKELLHYVDAFESESEMSFCLWTWRDAMKYLLDAIEGSTISVVHDHHIMQKLHDMYDTIDSRGKKRTAHALRLFSVYDRLKHSTYEQVKNTMSKSSFYRAMTELQSIGLAKEQLQNLHVDEHVPLAQVLTFDFENQKPDNYQRPDTNGIDTPDKLFAYLSGDSIETVTLSELDKIKDSLESHNMPSLYARALQAGREVRLSQDTSVSFVLYDDGTHDLVYHSPGNKHKSIDLSPSAWSAANQ
ncbi:phage/plasmid replication protein, II/X family [Vibrio mediterranei]